MEEIRISCCQNSSTCSRPIQQWLHPNPVFCRHNSNGLFGAIRENNGDVARYFIRQFGNETMATLLRTHETAFGDTCLTFASSLGRLDILTLLLEEVRRIVHSSPCTVAIGDIINRETSRGKVAIIEAIKHGQVQVASTLLSNGANIELESKTHGRSALKWAVTMNNKAILTMINKHMQLSEHVSSLFKAISNGDKNEVLSLIEGGTPYRPFSPSPTDLLERLRIQLNEGKRKKSDLQQQLSREEVKLDEAKAEKERRSKAVDDLRNERQDIVSTRRKDFIQVVAAVKLAAIESNVDALCNSQSQSLLECELIAKALCTLFYIKVNEEESDTDTPFFDKLRAMMKDEHNFLHRIKNFQLFPSQAKLAASVRVKGIPGACSDYVNMLNESTSLCSLMLSIAEYLKKIFEQTPTHDRERDLLMKQRHEDDMLQRISTDIDVLKSRCGILHREMGDTTDSITRLERQLIQLERQNVVAAVMNTKALTGHTVLSWAAASGNVGIVTAVLKHGANTAIEDQVVGSCAIIIQASYRHYRWKRDFSRKEDLEYRERDRCVNLRIRSLSRFIRNQLQRIRLPLAEALFNGHAEVASLLDKSDISLFQAINMLHLFHAPGCTFPRPSMVPSQCFESNIEALMSSISLAGSMLHDNELRDCPFLASLKFATSTIEAFLQHRKHSLERKITSRRDTIFQNHRNKKISELTTEMHQNNFDSMIKASEQAGISLDYEDVTGMTPLIRAVIVECTTQHRYKRRPGGKEMSAVAYN